MAHGAMPSEQQGYFVGNAEPTSEMIRHSWAAPSTSRIQPRRREWMVAPHRRRSEVILEE